MCNKTIRIISFSLDDQQNLVLTNSLNEQFKIKFDDLVIITFGKENTITLKNHQNYIIPNWCGKYAYYKNNGKSSCILDALQVDENCSFFSLSELYNSCKHIVCLDNMDEIVYVNFNLITHVKLYSEEQYIFNNINDFFVKETINYRKNISFKLNDDLSFYMGDFNSVFENLFKYLEHQKTESLFNVKTLYATLLKLK